MNSIDTDRDIIAYIKRMFSTHEVSDYISLYVTMERDDECATVMWCFDSASIDDMVIRMFDLSLTKRIRSIDMMVDWKGRLCALEVDIADSEDHQTNITGNLIDLFRILADPNALERLKHAPDNTIDLWEEILTDEDA